MDFHYSSFNGRIVFNPTDFILRFEHKDTQRTYERVFFERDFSDLIPLGGIEFVEKAFQSLFICKSPSGLSIKDFEQTPNEITFLLSYTNTLFPRPIELSFTVPALRSASAGADVEVMSRRLKEMSASMEMRLAELERSLATTAALADRVKELEKRCGHTITLPGCDYAIPCDLTSLTLVRNGTEIMGSGELEYFCSSMYPGYYTKSLLTYNNGNSYNTYCSPVTPESPHQGPQYHNGSSYMNVPICWEKTNGTVFVFHKLSDISNLKYLTKLTSISIYGANECHDYSPLAHLKNLQSLSIISARKSTGKDAVQKHVSDGSRPVINSVSWISELKNLHTVSFLGCSSLVDIRPIADLPRLSTLDIRETGVKNTSFLTCSSLTITKS
jgi:hypothetical protein